VADHRIRVKVMAEHPLAEDALGGDQFSEAVKPNENIYVNKTQQRSLYQRLGGSYSIAVVVDPDLD
jgi:hypothetical protein